MMSFEDTHSVPCAEQAEHGSGECNACSGESDACSSECAVCSGESESGSGCGNGYIKGRFSCVPYDLKICLTSLMEFSEPLNLVLIKVATFGKTSHFQILIFPFLSSLS